VIVTRVRSNSACVSGGAMDVPRSVGPNNDRKQYGNNEREKYFHLRKQNDIESAISKLFKKKSSPVDFIAF